MGQQGNRELGPETVKWEGSAEQSSPGDGEANTFPGAVSQVGATRASSAPWWHWVLSHLLLGPQLPAKGRLFLHPCLVTGCAQDAVLLFRIGTMHWVDLQRFTAVWFGLADSLFMARLQGRLVGPRRTKKIIRVGHRG